MGGIDSGRRWHYGANDTTSDRRKTVLAPAAMAIEEGSIRT